MSTSFLTVVAQRADDALKSPRVTPGIRLAGESTAFAAARGMREKATFSYRGVQVEYSELPDAESNLLFGNVLWPCAETLTKLLVDQQRGGP